MKRISIKLLAGYLTGEIPGDGVSLSAVFHN